MGRNSGVEWTDYSWGPWIGCTKVSEGCLHCYGERDMKRYGRDPHTVTRTSKATFNAPLRWKEPGFVFVCPWSDFFHVAADDWRREAWDIMRATPHLTYLVLTKRPERMRFILFPIDWDEGWPNVWLGVTAENQKRARERLPLLLAVPAARRFVSCEPLLSSICLEEAMPCRYYCDPAVGHVDHSLRGIDWVIAGGESGKDRRFAMMHWFRQLRDECQSKDVPFFLKQMEVGGQLVKMPKLDGKVWAERPTERIADV